MLNKYGVFFGGRNTANWCIIVIIIIIIMKGERNGDQCLKNIFSSSNTLILILTTSFCDLNMWPQIKTLYENIYFDLLILISQD